MFRVCTWKSLSDMEPSQAERICSTGRFTTVMTGSTNPRLKKWKEMKQLFRMRIHKTQLLHNFRVNGLGTCRLRTGWVEDSRQ